MITEIMHLDNNYDDLSPLDRKKQRQKHLLPRVDAYFEWVKFKYDQVTHNSIIGKALAYSIHQEEYLRKSLFDGNIPLDKNYAEQAIRPFTLGRKYFELLLSELPNHMNDTDLRFIDDLMPWSPRIQRECPSHLKKS